MQRLYRQGFAGMTLRQLAGDVGIQAGSLYNYFQNKQHFLFELLEKVMTDLTDEMDARLQGVETPEQALLAFIECHVSFHSSRNKEVIVSTMELRSLTPENYTVIVLMRDQYEGRLRDILEWGNRTGCWLVPDSRVATKIILGMMTSVGSWYRPGGRYRISDLVLIYQKMVENQLRLGGGPKDASPKLAS
nr:TetR/AcrR family transcriptional regulator [Sneathiella chinensis]